MKMSQGLSHLRAAVFTAVLLLRGLVKLGHNFKDNAEMPILILCDLGVSPPKREPMCTVVHGSGD